MYSYSGEVIRAVRDLHDAISNQDTAGITSILDHSEARLVDVSKFFVGDYGSDSGAGREVTEDDDLRPLMRAALSENLDTVQLLLERGADLYKTNLKENNILHYAVQQSNIKMVELILKKVPHFIHAQNKSGYSPWMLAAKEANPAIIQLFLDPTLRSYQTETVLHLAVKANNEAMLDLLLQHGHLPQLLNECNNHGETPLMLAIQLGHFSVVQVLLVQGANVNLQNDEREISLHYVARMRHNPSYNHLLEKRAALEKREANHLYGKIVKALLGFGANFAIKDDEQLTSFDCLKFPLKKVIFDSYGLIIVDAIQVLSAFKANFIARDAHGQLRLNKHVTPGIEKEVVTFCYELRDILFTIKETLVLFFGMSLDKKNPQLTTQLETPLKEMTALCQAIQKEDRGRYDASQQKSKAVNTLRMWLYLSGHPKARKLVTGELTLFKAPKTDSELEAEKARQPYSLEGTRTLFKDEPSLVLPEELQSKITAYYLQEVHRIPETQSNLLRKNSFLFKTDEKQLQTDKKLAFLPSAHAVSPKDRDYFTAFINHRG